MNPVRLVVYFLRKALGSIRENPFINLVTVGTIAIAMILFGSFLLVFVNLQAVVDRMGGDVEMSAYLREDASATQVTALGDRLKRMPEVSEVVFVSKQEALASFRKNNPEDAPLLEELGDNPFPASYQIRLGVGHRDPETVARIASDLSGDASVDEVEYGREWIERFSAFLKLLQVIGTGLGGMLVLAVVFVVSNTIKLAMFARRDELEIMQLVGATAAFIRVPYLIEGLLQGGIGALLALGGLWIAWRELAARAVHSFAPVFGASRIVFLPRADAWGLLAGGMLLGLLGSFFAMGRFLRGPERS